MRPILTRKQIKNQKITQGLIFDNRCQKGLVYDDEYEGIISQYTYDYDTKDVIDYQLGLSEGLVNTIVDMISAGIDNVAISRELSIPVTTVYEVQSGNVYKDITTKKYCPPLLYRNKYSNEEELRIEQKEAMIHLKLAGYNYFEIGNITSVNTDRVKEYLQKANYIKSANLDGPINKKVPPRVRLRLDSSVDEKDNIQYKHTAQMSEKEILWIADKLQQGYTLKDISSMGGYDKECIRNIRRKLTHKKLLKDYSFPKLIGEQTVEVMPHYKIIGICEDLQAGVLSEDEIATKYDVSWQSVYLIHRRKHFKDISSNYVW